MAHSRPGLRTARCEPGTEPGTASSLCALREGWRRGGGVTQDSGHVRTARRHDAPSPPPLRPHGEGANRLALLASPFLETKLMATHTVQGVLELHPKGFG